MLRELNINEMEIVSGGHVPNPPGEGDPLIAPDHNARNDNGSNLVPTYDENYDYFEPDQPQ